MTKKLLLLIPCIVDQLYPEMGLSMAKILRSLGYELSYEPKATCCGQPAYNAGQHEEARRVARSFISVLNQYDLAVCPSGSCTAMIRNFYPELFRGQSDEVEARSASSRVREFFEFLNSEGVLRNFNAKGSGKVGLHNSCHSARELGLKTEARKVLECIQGVEIIEPLNNPGVEPACCGFGGLFSVKFEKIAASIGKSRLEMFHDAGAEVLLSNDPGCIMHLRQQAKALRLPIQVKHLAEFLCEGLGL